MASDIKDSRYKYENVLFSIADFGDNDETIRIGRVIGIITRDDMPLIALFQYLPNGKTIQYILA